MSATLIHESLPSGEDAEVVSVTASILSSSEIAGMAVLDIQPPYSDNEKALLQSLLDSNEPYNIHWIDVPQQQQQSYSRGGTGTGKASSNAEEQQHSSKQLKIIQQLNHPLLGTTDFRKRCAKCGAGNCSDTGHMGCSTLYWPLHHIGFANTIFKIVTQLCYFCSRFLNPILDDIPIVEDDMGGTEQWKRFWSHAKHVTANFSADAKQAGKEVTCPHCKMPQPLYSIQKDKISIAWYASHNWTPTKSLMKRVAHSILMVYASNKAAFANGLLSCCTSHNADDQQHQNDIPCELLGKVVLHLLSKPLQTLNDNERWLLNAVAFLNPSYRTRLFSQPLTSAKIRSLLSMMRGDDVDRMGMNARWSHPESMAWTILPIASKALRPTISEASGTESAREDDMTRKYVDILTASAKVRYFRTLMMLKTMRNILQMVLDSVIPESLLVVLNDYPPWHFTDMRSCWYDWDAQFLQSIVDMQYEVSSLVNQKAVADAQPGTSHNSGKMGAKNAEKSPSSAVAGEEQVHDVAEHGDGMDVNTAQMEMDGGVTAVGGGGGRNTSSSANTRKGKSSRYDGPVRISASGVVHSTAVQEAHMDDESEHDQHKIAHQCICHFFHQADNYFDESILLQWVQTDDADGEGETALYGHSSVDFVGMLCQLWSQCEHLKTKQYNLTHPSLLIASATVNTPAATGSNKAASAQQRPMPTVAGKVLFKPTLPKRTSTTYTKKKPKTKSIADKQGSKAGRLRDNVGGKRGDFNSRKVLTPDAHLALSDVGIAEHSCNVQHAAVVVTNYNRKVLQELVANGSEYIAGAEKIVTGHGEGCIINIPKAVLDRNGKAIPWKHPSEVYLEIGWRVHVYLQDGVYVIVNRQPTLHRGSHNAARVKRTKGRRIVLNECVLVPYNGDCDGDAVCASYMQTIPALVEAGLLMSVPCNMICPRTHRPIVSLHHDSLLAACLLTRLDTLLNEQDALEILSAIRMVTPLRQRKTVYVGFDSSNINNNGRRRDDGMYSSPWSQEERITYAAFCTSEEDRVWKLPNPHVILPSSVDETQHEPYWTGRQLFAIILPGDLEYVKECADLPSAGKNMTLQEKIDDAKQRLVWFHQGQWICGNGCKEVLGVSQKNLVHHLWRYYGKQYACDVLSDWAFMAHAYLRLRGFTCSASDVALGGVPPSDFHSTIEETNSFPFMNESKEIASIAGNVAEREVLFQYLALNKKDEAYAVLHNAFAKVNQFIADNVIHLTSKDVEHAYAQLEAYAHSMFLYLGNVTTALTDESKNNVSLMKNNGSKGSTANSTQMAASLMMEMLGGRFPIGALITPNSRVLPSERHGEMTARTLGVIEHGFSEGQTSDETLKHSILTWDRVYQSTGADKGGYQQRKIDATCGSITVQYDGTVRNGGGEIIQIIYGGDGYDPLKVQSINLPPSVLNPIQSFNATKSRITASISEFNGNGSATHSIGDKWADLNSCSRFFWSAATTAANNADNGTANVELPCCPSCKHLLSQQVYCTHALLREKANQVFQDWKTVEQLQKSGVTVYLTVKVDDMARIHESRWKKRLNDWISEHYKEKTDSEVAIAAYMRHVGQEQFVSHEEFAHQVDSLCQSLLDRVKPAAVPLDLIVHVRSVLSHFNVFEIDFSSACRRDLEELFIDIYLSYCEAMVQPGTAVGTSANQSISEPNIQMVFRAFKPDSVGSRQMLHLAHGGDFMDQLLGNRDPTVSTTTCAFSPVWVKTSESARVAAEQMVKSKLGHWMKSAVTLWTRMVVGEEEEVNDTSYANDSEMDNQHPLYWPIVMAVTASYDQLRCSRIGRDWKIQQHQPDDHGFAMPKTQIFSLFQLETATVLRGDGPSAVGSIIPWKIQLEQRLSQLLLPFQRGILIGGSDVDEDAPYYWCLWHMNDAFSQDCAAWTANVESETWHSNFENMTVLANSMMTRLVVTGYDGIEELLSIDEPSSPLSEAQMRLADEGLMEILPSHCYVAVLKGSNFLSILGHCATMDQFCHTSNCKEVTAIYDVSADNQNRAFSFENLLKSDGTTYVQPRHPQLLANTMTSEGIIIPVNRKGLAQKHETGFISVIAFEDTAANILDAAFKSKRDPMRQNAADVAYGKKFPFTGTGIAGAVPIHPLSHASTGHSSRDYNVDRTDTSLNDLMLQYINFVKTS